MSILENARLDLVTDRDEHGGVRVAWNDVYDRVEKGAALPGFLLFWAPILGVGVVIYALIAGSVLWGLLGVVMIAGGWAGMKLFNEAATLLHARRTIIFYPGDMVVSPDGLPWVREDWKPLAICRVDEVASIEFHDLSQWAGPPDMLKRFQRKETLKDVTVISIFKTDGAKLAIGENIWQREQNNQIVVALANALREARRA